MHCFLSLCLAMFHSHSLFVSAVALLCISASVQLSTHIHTIAAIDNNNATLIAATTESINYTLRLIEQPIDDSSSNLATTQSLRAALSNRQSLQRSAEDSDSDHDSEPDHDVIKRVRVEFAIENGQNVTAAELHYSMLRFFSHQQAAEAAAAAQSAADGQTQFDVRLLNESAPLQLALGKPQRFETSSPLLLPEHCVMRAAVQCIKPESNVTHLTPVQTIDLDRVNASVPFETKGQINATSITTQL